MRALNDRELDSVSGGCFGLLTNLLGGLFGGLGHPQAQAQAQAQSQLAAPSAAAQGVTAGRNVVSGISALETGVSNFLRNPIGGVVSLINTGIQDAVNFFTRLI